MRRRHQEDKEADDAAYQEGGQGRQGRQVHGHQAGWQGSDGPVPERLRQVQVAQVLHHQGQDRHGLDEELGQNRRGHFEVVLRVWRRQESRAADRKGWLWQEWLRQGGKA